MALALTEEKNREAQNLNLDKDFDTNTFRPTARQLGETFKFKLEKGLIGGHTVEFKVTDSKTQ